MKKYLLPEGGNFYKANLHCHTTVSDGSFTPEEVKAAYKSRGYSIIAYTDHDIMIDHDNLREADFLPLLGYEMEINVDTNTPFARIPTCHLCLIARDRENAKQVCWHRSKYLFGNADKYKHLVKFDESLPDYERVYSHQGINDIIAKAKAGNFFVTYNHPNWSLESYPEYSGYEGMNAMEMFNFGSLNEGYDDYNPSVYDDLLRQGKRIYCIGADDNHGSKNPENRYFDFFGAFTMIKAETLEYSAVIEALDNGNFYASQGPEITELYVKDGKVYIKCSEAAQITYTTGIRHGGTVKAKNDVPVTEAVFDIHPDDIYFRLTITDEKGLHATTNAYFVDKIL